MPAPNNTTKSANIDVTAREIDFVSRFNTQWDSLREILGVVRPIKKSPGTKLVTKKATVDLHSGSVGEGEDIPFSQANVVEVEIGTATVDKWAKNVTIEAINDKGYDAAIQSTDDEFLNELQAKVVTDFYTFIQTGTLRATYGTFKMALAMAQGNVIDRWKKMRKSTTAIVGFCNILDAYTYLGAVDITVQNQFGINYVENFLGYKTLILSSEIPQGTVIATPAENIVNYYVDPSDSAFARAGLPYRTAGDTNLIGFHTEGTFKNASSVAYAIMGNYLYAEYMDGIAVCTIDAAAAAKDADLATLTIGSLKLTPKFDKNVVAYSATTTNATDVITATAVDSGNATVVIKNGSTTVESGSAATWAAGVNTVTVTVTNSPATKVYTVSVTKK